MKKGKLLVVSKLFCMVAVLITTLVMCVGCGKSVQASHDITVRMREYTGGIVDTDYGRWSEHEYSTVEGQTLFLPGSNEATVTSVSDRAIDLSLSNTLVEVETDMSKEVDNVTVYKGQTIHLSTAGTTGYEIEISY